MKAVSIVTILMIYEKRASMLTVATAETAEVVGYSIKIVSVRRQLRSWIIWCYPVELGILGTRW
jgi:hypothetical protein